MCIGEFVKYKFSINKSGNARCKSDAGSCERALCECDRQFAIDHAAATGVYTDDFHAFWAPNGWDPEGQCMKGGNGQNDPQCCGGNNAPYVSYDFDNNRKNVSMRKQNILKSVFRPFTMQTRNLAVLMDQSNHPECAKMCLK